MDEPARHALAQWTLALPAVSAYVHALVGHAADRDDILQDTALAVIESYPRFDRSRPFLPWALSIARARAIDFARLRSLRPLALSPAAAEALAVAFEQVSDLERTRLDHLRECLDRLDARSREACELRYRSGMQPAQISEHLRLQPNTVAKVLQRAREQLRDCIEQRAAQEVRA